MPIATTALITTSSKILSPIIVDLYKNAKGQIQQDLTNWSNAKAARTTAKTLAKFEMVKTLWSPDKEISIHDFYYPSKLGNEFKATKIESLDDLPSGNVVVQGIVGQGKSIFMRYLASTALRSKKSISIPLFLELRTLSSKLNLKQAIFQLLSTMDINISEESFEYLATSGKILLLLDGFDEISDELVQSTLNEIEFLQTKYPDLRIIVSSRLGNEIQKISGFVVVNLAPLTPKDYPPFLGRLKIDSQKRTELIHAISSSPTHISGIIRTPLMMTLVVMVYESEREIPPTLPEFFERLFQVVFSRHDRIKAGFNRKHYSGLSERRLQQLFEAFCFMTIQSGYGRSLSREQFITVFDLAVEYTQHCECEMEKFRHDITKVSCLMLDEGIDLATFLHKSILEYYAAAYIKHSLEDVAKLFYSIALSDFKHWEEVLSFLREIDSYRYSKDYTLEESTPFLEEVTTLLKSHKVSDLISFIEKYQPEITATFQKPLELNQQAEINYFSMSSLPASYSLNTFSELIIKALNDTIPQSLSYSELAGIVSVQQFSLNDEAPDSIDMDTKSIIKHFGETEFWLAINQFEQKLIDEISRANAIIESQEKRKLIFQKKPINSK